ncbi:hypothetical protein RB595_008089 [Gaeumannomyces hyphopodioides]
MAMRSQLPLARPAKIWRLRSRPHSVCRQCRAIQIAAAPSAQTPQSGGDVFGAPAKRDAAGELAHARFEVIGSPYSLLSVTLSASQKLYTRRGTLVSVAGKVENAQSTLSILSPVRRALLGVPFLYQRISSTTPITALIGTKSPNTTFSILHLDGTTDWMVAQRNALLAWTGHTLTPSPRIQRGLSLAHWGSTHLTGRGLAALSSPGQIYEVTLADGEELIVHPSHVAAYSLSRSPPLPFRLRSNRPLNLQAPALPASLDPRSLVPERLVHFAAAMRHTETYKGLARIFLVLRTAARRSIWGDRLFLQFHGPTTILMSSRGVRLADSLSPEDVNEIADAETGVVTDAIELSRRPEPTVESPAASRESKPMAIHIANIGRDGKAKLEEAKDLSDFVR